MLCESGFRLVCPEVEVQPQHWFIFEGAMCAAFYYQGIMQGIYQRFGKERFAALHVGYAGSSSGGYCAGYAGTLVTHGPYDCRHWALGQMGVPPKVWRLLPLGLIFAASSSLKESGMWGMRTVKKFSQICKELDKGTYLMWMIHPFISSSRVFWWRQIVKCTSEGVNRFGDECAAGGLLPILHPGLCWPYSGPALDGHLHFPPLLPKPVLEDPQVCPGKRFVFGMSHRPEPAMDHAVRIDCSEWRKFSLWRDFLLCLGFSLDDDAARLFELGFCDLQKHVNDIDPLIKQIFDLDPLPEAQ